MIKNWLQRAAQKRWFLIFDAYGTLVELDDFYGHLQRNLARCVELVEACFKSNDYTEGRRAFMEKRKPAFTGT